MDPGLILFLALYGIIGVGGLWLLAHLSGKVHETLRSFRTRAEKIDVSLDELRAIRAELVAYGNKECWNRHYADHAREVMAFIDGRILQFQHGL